MTLSPGFQRVREPCVAQRTKVGGVSPAYLVLWNVLVTFCDDGRSDRDTHDENHGDDHDKDEDHDEDDKHQNEDDGRESW